MRRFIILTSLTTTALLAGSPAPAGAALSVWNFEATVQTYDDGAGLLPTPTELIALGITPGASVVGSITLDDSVVDSDPGDGTRGVYLDAVTSASFSVGGLDATFLGGSATAEIVDTGAGDFISLTWGAQDTIPELNVLAGTLEFLDSTGTFLSDDSFVNTPPDLAALDPFAFAKVSRGTRFRMGMSIGGDIIVVNAELNMLAVPAPAGALVLLMAPGFARRRRS